MKWAITTDEEAAGVSEETSVHLGKCIRPFVLIAEQNAKCHLSLAKMLKVIHDQSIAKIATRTTKSSKEQFSRVLVELKTTTSCFIFYYLLYSIKNF